MSDIKEIIKQQKDFFSEGKTIHTDYRRTALKKLMVTVKRHENDINTALKKDLNKSPFEAYASEIGMVYTELKEVIKRVEQWNRRKKVRTPLMHFKSASYIVSEPYGVTLIMSPWNYPFQLTIAPLIGAIAGGNCAILKPSEYSPNTSAVISVIIKECFKENYIAVVEGGIAVNQELLQQKFDYIFFTGSIGVGKLVMEAAAKNLTPVTLELGGKSPCIVYKDADIDLAAKRIIWGKTLNSGQTCVSPDYLLVHKEVKDKLLEAMRKYIKIFYGDKPCENQEFPKIINEKHFNRLKEFLKGKELIIGGEYNEKTLQMSPAVLEDVTWESPVMQEEIFGPILPVLEFKNINEVITMVNSHSKPLALYLFTRSKAMEKKIVSSISFGGGCINDTLVHLATSYMPFGGVGDSGMGGYHGKWSFDTFTHKKSIMKKSNLIDINLRYAPYRDKLKLLKKIL